MTVFNVTPTRLPETAKTTMYKGDFFSISLIGTNTDDSPTDFSLYTDFKAQIRVGDPRNPNVLHSFVADDFLLGKSDEEQEEYDELHVTSADALVFSTPYPNLWMDVQGQYNGEIRTFIKIKISIDPEVTRE